MKLSRRNFLMASAAGGLVSSLKAQALINKQGILVSAASDWQGRHWAICLKESGELISQLKLPARAHEVLTHPNGNEIVTIGRRPGQYLIVSSIRSGRVIKYLKPQLGYHFYGHALFTPNGRYLVTTENHIDSGQGYIFIRDSESNYEITSYFSSQGVGPHQIKLASDNDTLIIANGGILTHPDKGRKKLNLETMSPSLVYVSLKSGKLLENVKLDDEYHQLSIRHIDINIKDEVLIGMQYQGDPTDQVPLVASHKRGESLKPLWAPESINYAMKQYCGSVCFDPSGKIAAISSPKGNLITLWDYEQQQFLSSARCKDACGIASNKVNEFIISNGLGQLFHVNTLEGSLDRTSPNLQFRAAWDNHLSIL
jgi:hypothetical protein